MKALNKYTEVEIHKAELRPCASPVCFLSEPEIDPQYLFDIAPVTDNNEKKQESKAKR
ncbi:hypothetical protein [Echinicola shivajiensis]|uniref:hypothetical protein n=1 Tax=Echinicola shivajiensis TaxID=1035916 RepID=UPI001BFC887A|nr:hypothetical protein [Echinicola shivajiensis]